MNNFTNLLTSNEDFRFTDNISEEAFFGNTTGVLTNSNNNVLAQNVEIPITLSLQGAFTGIDPDLPNGGFTSLVIGAQASSPFGIITNLDLPVSVTIFNQVGGVDIIPPRNEVITIDRLGSQQFRFDNGPSTSITINGGTGTASVLSFVRPFVATFSAAVPPFPGVITPTPIIT